jgi:hypothetical protein
MIKTFKMKPDKVMRAGTIAIAMQGWTNPGHSNHICSDPLCEDNLKAEYELIQQKKSNLSATQRRAVVLRFEATNK